MHLLLQDTQDLGLSGIAELWRVPPSVFCQQTKCTPPQPGRKCSEPLQLWLVTWQSKSRLPPSSITASTAIDETWTRKPGRCHGLRGSALWQSEDAEVHDGILFWKKFLHRQPGRL